MLSNYEPTVENLIYLTNNGLQIATFSQIKTALIDRYKDIYGSDIDVDDSTADGVFINNIALILNNTFNTVNALYNNLDIKNASGTYLDMLCALSNIRRKQATYSSFIAEVVNTSFDTDVRYNASDLTIIDNNGIEWLAQYGINFNVQRKMTVEYICSIPGAIVIDSSWSAAIIKPDVAVTFSVYSSVVGSEEEDDYSLRTRQMNFGSGAGDTVLTGLQSALLEINGILDARILTNVDAEDFNFVELETLNNDAYIPTYTTLSPKSVYITLRYDPTVEVSDEVVGTVIYSKLTPGIRTVRPNVPITKSYEYTVTINGIASSELDRQTVYWKKTDNDRHVSFTINTYANFVQTEVDTIAKNLMRYFNSLNIGVLPTEDELRLKCIAADPLSAGVATYTCTSAELDLGDKKYNDAFYFTNYIWQSTGMSNEYELDLV